MTATNSLDRRVDELGKASRRAALLSIVGFLAVLAALGGAITGLKSLESQREALSHRADSLRYETTALETKVKELTLRANGLEATQSDLLDFLGRITAEESIRLIYPGTDWMSTKSSILALPAGPRKSVILSALLLAWKTIPFSLQNRGLSQGLDSPHFMNSVLQRYGVGVTPGPGERLSHAMMRTFEQTATPEPGDLLFYRGHVGSFVLMYIAPGSPDGQGVAIGSLQTGQELMVVDTAFVRTEVFSFIGAFRVPYESSRS